MSVESEGVHRATAQPDTRPFARRFVEYQRERFPFLQHGPLIVVFAFSAASYSRICRGAQGFIPLADFVPGAITALYFFLLLRLYDEHKDFEEDARWRPYRAVPRGLVSLRELRTLGIVLTAVIVAINALVMPRVLPAVGAVLLYTALMGREFFVRGWLKRHPIVYMLSHMLVLPVIDFYTSGLDWINAGVAPPAGLEFFLGVTFLNGIVIELGRKIRAPEDEEEGVETYSALYGSRRAALGWACVLVLTWGGAVAAALRAGEGTPVLVALSTILLLCLLPALLFARTPGRALARRIELAAGLWTIGMYLTLGGAPMVARWIEGL